MTRRAVRDRWYAAVICTRLVTGPCRELLSLMAVRHMTETGHCKVPRSDLAAALGITEHRITVLIGQATKAMLLVKVGGGHNGQTSTYAAQLPDTTKGALSGHPSSELKGAPSGHPSTGVGIGQRAPFSGHPSGGVQDDEGCSERAPIHARVSKNYPSNGTPPALGRGAREDVLTSTAVNNGEQVLPDSSNCRSSGEQPLAGQAAPAAPPTQPPLTTHGCAHTDGPRASDGRCVLCIVDRANARNLAGAS